MYIYRDIGDYVYIRPYWATRLIPGHFQYIWGETLIKYPKTKWFQLDLAKMAKPGIS